MKKMKYLSKDKLEGAARFQDEHRQVNPSQTLDSLEVEDLTEEDLMIDEVVQGVDLEENRAMSENAEEVEDLATEEILSEETFVPSSSEDLTEKEIVPIDWNDSDLNHESATEAQESKSGFWNMFKRNVLEEPVKVVTEEPVQKEESSMSYSAKQSGYEQDTVAVISKSMVIRGDVELDTSLIFAGKIIGNVVCKDAVESISGGSIEGNLTALSAEFVGGNVKGNVSATEKIVVDEDTVVEGDVSAKDIVISGKVVGEVKATGSVKLTHTANIKGDLHAASVSIEAGARLEGKFIVSAAE